MSNLAGCPSRLDVRVGWMSKSAGCPSRLDVRVGWMSSRLDVQLVGCPVGWMSFGWMSESAGCPSRLDVRRLDVQSAGSPVGWMSSRLDVQSAGCPSAGCLSAGCESAGCPQVVFRYKDNKEGRMNSVFYLILQVRHTFQISDNPSRVPVIVQSMVKYI